MRPALNSRSASRVALDVGEPERAQAFLGRRRSERTGAGERVENRREEQLLVETAHDGLLRAMALVELLERRLAAAIAEPENPREPGAEVVGFRKGVRLLFVDELEAMFHGAQPDVRVGEPVGIVARHVAALGEGAERVERRRRADALVGAAVHELEQLHGELDVADAAPTALHLALLEAAPVQLRLAARLHRTDLAHDVGTGHVGKDAPLRLVEELRRRAARRRRRGGP